MGGAQRDRIHRPAIILQTAGKNIRELAVPDIGQTAGVVRGGVSADDVLAGEGDDPIAVAAYGFGIFGDFRTAGRRDVGDDEEELSGEYDVSRERIRQIEVRAFEKLQKKMRDLAAEKGLLRAVN